MCGCVKCSVIFAASVCETRPSAAAVHDVVCAISFPTAAKNAERQYHDDDDVAFFREPAMVGCVCMAVHLKDTHAINANRCLDTQPKIIVLSIKWCMCVYGSLWLCRHADQFQLDCVYCKFLKGEKPVVQTIFIFWLHLHMFRIPKIITTKITALR